MKEKIKSMDHLKSFLRANVVDLKFTKVDGTERVMKCTLVPNLLPEIEINENKKTRKENLDIIKVYDLEKNGWRSFRFENLIDFTFNLAQNEEYSL